MRVKNGSEGDFALFSKKGWGVNQNDGDEK